MPPGRFPIVAALLCALVLPACDRGPDRVTPRAKPRGPRSVMPAARPVIDTTIALDVARPSVVVVECLDRRRNVVAQGTGVIVAADTVVTAWPLVSRAFTVRVRTSDRSANADIEAVLEDHSLARLRVNAPEPIELGRDTPPLAGATIYAVGAPQGDTLSPSPLRRLPGADRAWLVQLMAAVVREDRRLTGLGLERAHAQLDPLVGAELSWVKVELGLGFLSHQRIFWEDAIEARAFRRAVKSSRRAEWEERLLVLGALTRRDIAEGDRIMRAIAAHEPFDIPGARIDADERWITQRIGHTDAARDHIETQLWAARSR